MAASRRPAAWRVRMRGRGPGRALLAEMREQARRQGAASVLLICERASAGRQTFVAATGSQHVADELRMALTTLAPDAGRPGGGALTIRRATVNDEETVARISTSAFHDDLSERRWKVAAEFADPTTTFYLGERDGIPVSGLNVYRAGTTAGIYGFGVLEGEQGHGLGRQMLTQIARRLLAEGARRVTLEVEAANRRAHALYVSCGFREVTTYG